MVAKPITQHRFTIDDVYRMLCANVLREDARVELIEGELLDMAPIGGRHASAVTRLQQLLGDQRGPGVFVTTQGPLWIASDTVPQPDLMVCRGDALQTDDMPSAADALLVIEVSDTTYRHDRRIKTPLYARAEIPEVWIVNLNSIFIEVCRDPGPDGYAAVTRYTRGDTISPLRLPHIRIAVSVAIPRRTVSRTR